MLAPQVHFGNMLITANGAIAGQCCCGGGSPQPSSCPNPNDPELYLTVFDADYAGGNISWCGEVWTQAQVQAGLEQGPVCPTAYYNDFAFTSPFSQQVTAAHYWRYGNSLIIRRQQIALQSTLGKYVIQPGGWDNFINVKATNGSHYGDQTFVHPLGSYVVRPINIIATLTSGDAQLTAIVKKPAPRPPPHGTYKLPTTFTEATFTTNGIAYSWRRGNGW